MDVSAKAEEREIENTNDFELHELKESCFVVAQAAFFLQVWVMLLIMVLLQALLQRITERTRVRRNRR